VLVVAVAVVGAATLVLEPHRLVVVNAHVIAAIFNEDVHDADAELDITGLKSVHRANSIDCSIGLIEVAGLLV